MGLRNKLLAEFFGTFWLVLGGCGSAMLAAKFGSTDGINIGLVGVSLAFGLTVLTMAYAVGHVSGGHFNPAVSIGLAAGGRILLVRSRALRYFTSGGGYRCRLYPRRDRCG